MFAALLVAVLIMINIQVEQKPHPNFENFEVSVFNEAMATIQPKFEMTTQRCWNTGKTIKICRYAEAECNVSGQDPC